MSPLIKPTVGHKVHFMPHGALEPGEQPWDANIVKVHSDRTVNVAGFDPNGVPFARHHVQLLQEDDPVPDHAHAAWMPYQQQVANQAKLGMDVEMDQGRLAKTMAEQVADAARQGFRHGNPPSPSSQEG